MTDRRTVLVTGAARRIGAAIAHDLALSGWHVLVHFHRSEDDAQALARQIGEHGGSCDLVKADLSRRDEVEALIPKCTELAGPLDCLINNAALFKYDHIDRLEWGLWDEHLRANLTAPAFLCRDFARQLPAGRSGVIINLLDQKTAHLNPDFLSYTVAKIGLRDLTRILAMAFGPRIRVCGISPNVTLISGKQTPQSFLKSTGVTPLGYSSSVAELVRAVHFILDTPSINGQIVTIDGGESLTGRRRDVAFETG